ncbi:MAG: helix-hairpin-helix domain-containing protein [Promethearchaeota archaeon]
MSDTSKMELGVKQGFDLNFIYTLAKGAIAERDVKDANKLIKMGLEQAKESRESNWISKFKSIRSELNEPVPSARVAVKEDLTVLKGIGSSAVEKLKNAGINTVAQLADKTPNQLSKIKGIGLETAKNIINLAKECEKNAINLEKEVVIEEIKSLTVKPKKEVLSGGIDSFLAKPEEVIVNKEKEKIGEEIETEPEIKEIFYDKGQEEIKEIKKIDVELEKEDFSDVETWYDIQENENGTESMSNNTSSEASLSATEQLYSQKFESMMSNFLSSEKKNIHKKETPEIVIDSQVKDFIEPASNFLRASTRTVPNHNIFLEEQFSIKTMKQVTKKTEEILRKGGYFIVEKRSIEPESVRNRVDLMALKIVNVSELLDVLVVIPIVVSNCKGTLIVSKDIVDYRPKNNLLEMTNSERKLLTESSVKNLLRVQDLIFRDLTSEHDSDSLRFFKNYLKMDVSVEKTLTNKNLFFRSGSLQYKVIIAPVLLCQNNPGFLEKSIPFAYQKKYNIHFVGASQLLELHDFLEKKYFFIDTFSKQENSLTEYFKSMDILANNVRLGSIPFLGFGLAFLFVLLFQVDFLLVEFVSVGFAAIAIYGVLLSFLWYKFFRKKSAIKEEFNTPYYQRIVKIDETDLHLICEELSPELIEQFTYECFDKDAVFDEILEVEKKKAKKKRFFDGLTKKKALNKKAVNIAGLEEEKEKEEEDLRFNSKSVRKYTSFLED